MQPVVMHAGALAKVKVKFDPITCHEGADRRRGIVLFF